MFVPPSTAAVNRPVPQFIPLAEIKFGPRCRNDMGDLDALAASMAALGLLQPVGLDPDLNLVFGERRCRAAHRLGWSDIPAIVFLNLDEAVLAARAERDENTCRKEFAPAELVEMGRRLEALEKPAAAERKKVHGGTAPGKPKNTGGNCPPVFEPGRTADKVGQALGVSGKTYTKAKKVVEAAEKEPDKFGDLPAVMETESVHAAHEEMKRRKTAVPIRIEEPEHVYDELMRGTTALIAKYTRYAGGDDDAAAWLRQCLTWCGLMEYTPARFADGVHHPAKVRFLPLAGVRAVVEAAGLPGRRKTEQEIKHVYQVASGGFLPPVVLRRRKQRAAAKGVRS
jgi:hypothetical protein